MDAIRVVNVRDVKQHWDRKTQTWDDPQYVYIGRRESRFYHLPESPWHNPYSPKQHNAAEHERVIKLYESYLMNNPALLARLPELSGKTLVCWCDPLPCHGHLLKRLAEEGGDE